MKTDPPTARRATRAGAEVAIPTLPAPLGVVEAVDMVRMTAEVVAVVEVAKEKAPTRLSTRVEVARFPKEI